METAPFNATAVPPVVAEAATKEVALILVPLKPADAAFTRISPRPLTAPPKLKAPVVVNVKFLVPDVNVPTKPMFPASPDNTKLFVKLVFAPLYLWPPLLTVVTLVPPRLILPVVVAFTLAKPPFVTSVPIFPFKLITPLVEFKVRPLAVAVALSTVPLKVTLPAPAAVNTPSRFKVMFLPNTIPDPAVVVDTVIVGLVAAASPNTTLPAPLSVIDPALNTLPNNCKI